MAGASQELVSYGGILLGRSTRALREWIERVVSPSDVYEFAYRTWPGSDRVAQPDISKGATSRVWEDITFRPFVPPRRIKLDTLYWPRDASRWAVGHFLASEKMVRLLRLKCYSGDEGKIAIRPQKLLINRCGDKLEPMLYMLPPRALSGITQTPQTNNLFLLTLVDQRYFWQFFDCGDGSGSGTETITTGWDQMLLRYAGMLPLSDLHSDSGPSDGFFSNKEEVSDKYQHPAHVLAEADSRPLPMLMDAAAYNMGKRLAFGLNGVLHAYTILESREILAKNLQTQKPRYAGHKFFFAVPRGTETGAVLPAAVKIAFPIFDIFNHWGGKWYKVTVDTTSISPYAKVNGIGTATFFETCPAYGDSPSNADELASLTREFAKDFLDHLYYANHDITYMGIVKWEPEGLTDSIEWCLHLDEDDYDQFRGKARKGGKSGAADGNKVSENADTADYHLWEGASKVTTRVQRGPWNCHPDRLNHWMNPPDDDTSGGSGSGSGSGYSGLLCDVVVGWECVNGIPVVTTRKVDCSIFK